MESVDAAVDVRRRAGHEALPDRVGLEADRQPCEALGGALEQPLKVGSSPCSVQRDTSS